MADDLTDAPAPDGNSADRQEAALNQIRQALRGLQFGQITIIVQDGVVVQIDRTERRRLKNLQK
jgi:hypothetical protein